MSNIIMKITSNTRTIQEQRGGEILKTTFFAYLCLVLTSLVYLVVTFLLYIEDTNNNDCNAN